MQNKIKLYSQGFLYLYERYPLFIISLSFLAGLSSFFLKSIALFFLLLILLLPLCFSKMLRKLTFFLITFFIGFVLGHFSYPKKVDISTPIFGKAHIKIDSIQKAKGFHKGYRYLATLISLQTKDEKIFYHLPCLIDHPNLMNANHIYLIDAKVRSITPYLLKMQTTSSKWIPIDKTFSLANIRFILKNNLRSFLRKASLSKRSFALYSTLLTGEIENQNLRYIFSKLGLQHLLAISGFHFAILTYLCFLFFRLFLSPAKTNVILLLFINLYFLFLGSSASIQRAYIMIEMILLSYIFCRRNFPLNALGASMLIELIFHPLHILHIGFQMSYLSVFAILLIYPKINHYLQKILNKRTKEEVKSLLLFDKVGYKFLTYIREALSITFAINLLLLPLCLYHFNTFPLLSFIYNIHIPLLITLLFSLLIFSICLYLLIPFLGKFLFLMNNYLTEFTLDLLESPPANLLFSWQVDSIPLSFMILYISCIIILFLALQTKAFFKKDSSKIDVPYIP